MTDKHKHSERDRLARERTFLANERTFLSYIRTGIMLFATGATLIKLFPLSTLFLALGILIIAFSFVTFVLGLFRYRKMKTKI